MKNVFVVALLLVSNLGLAGSPEKLSYKVSIVEISNESQESKDASVATIQDN